MRVAHALAAFVVQADRQVLRWDVQTRQVNHDRVREPGDPHPPARVGDHAELGQGLFAFGRFDGQRSAQPDCPTSGSRTLILEGWFV